MKIRNGFVSNSSSSSFIIAYKGILDCDEFTESVLLIPKKSPLFEFGRNVIDKLFKCSEEVSDVSDAVEEGYLSSDEGKDVEKMKADGFTVRAGSLSSEEWGLEGLLCDTDLNIKSDTLIIKHAGGY